MNKLMSRVILAGMLCGFYAGSAHAAVLDVQAEIKPDPGNPASAVIINNTPVTGYCAEYPGQCSGPKIRSNSFAITFQSLSAIAPGHVLPWGIPATWRRFNVQHKYIPGVTAEIEIRIAGVGTRYRLSNTAQSIIGAPGGWPVFDYHATLWAPSWSEGIAPCQRVNATSQGADPNGTDFTTFWLTPENVTTCPRSPKYNIPGMTLQRLDLHYEFRAVHPEKLLSGEYEGVYTYSVGSDFNLGSLHASDSSITFNLNLAVKQDVKVEMSSDKVFLAPKGGWMDWITNGRKDEKLLGDLRFSMLSTVPFKMELTCERSIGDTCAISNGSHQVPIDMSVSLPTPWVDNIGQPITRRPLTVTGTGLQHLKLMGFPTGQPSLLHFEVQPGSVKDMQGDSSYRGTVYVTFDSAI
ncbi:hypothetical protein DOZ80_29990 [Pseudomonas fluorescens]|uniref:Uncharacterized protein n=1 Tax=Pseudomonas fluorescens TaxID=294 RepID=A0A327MJ18_PSEFL|nr:hypothetical protein [Pseudomonas fluorescens]RAI62645.1 hypothetical protein DOZ80_29990 [Pseudomonas fluorescens]